MNNDSIGCKICGDVPTIEEHCARGGLAKPHGASLIKNNEKKKKKKRISVGREKPSAVDHRVFRAIQCFNYSKLKLKKRARTRAGHDGFFNNIIVIIVVFFTLDDIY